MESRESWVRRRAYEIWNDEGRPAGREFAHWRMANALFELETATSGSGRGGAGTHANAVVIRAGILGAVALDQCSPDRSQDRPYSNILRFPSGVRL